MGNGVKWIKQLFCEHFFITYAQDNPYFISAGDEYHDRRSIHYIHICSKCNKKIQSVSKWRNIEAVENMLKRPKAIETTEILSEAEADPCLND